MGIFKEWDKRVWYTRGGKVQQLPMPVKQGSDRNQTIYESCTLWHISEQSDIMAINFDTNFLIRLMCSQRLPMSDVVTVYFRKFITVGFLGHTLPSHLQVLTMVKDDSTVGFHRDLAGTSTLHCWDWTILQLSHHCELHIANISIHWVVGGIGIKLV